MWKRLAISVLSLVAVLTATSLVGAYDVPAYDGYVNDFADILSPEIETQLESELTSAAEASDGAEIAVVTITSLEGDTVENVTQEFFDEWQVGKEGLDNGVILLVAVDDRLLRIQTGYGAEPIITDAEAGRIIRNRITPEFKEGDFEAGVLAGVAAIQEQFEASPGYNPSIDPLNKDNGLISIFSALIGTAFFGIMLVVLFTYFASWLGRSKEWWPGGVVGLGLGMLLGSVVTGVFFSLLGLFLDYFLSKNYKKLKKAGKSTGWRKTWGGFSSGSGGGWSSGGSSFGGGSSGGGGASGGW